MESILGANLAVLWAKGQADPEVLYAPRLVGSTLIQCGSDDYYSVHVVVVESHINYFHGFVPLAVRLAAHLGSCRIGHRLLVDVNPVHENLEALAVPGVDLEDLHPDSHLVMFGHVELFHQRGFGSKHIEPSHKLIWPAIRNHRLTCRVDYCPSINVREDILTPASIEPAWL